MSRFEEIGVERQAGAKGTRDAVRKYENSCRICCTKGLRLDCDRCAIRHAHALVVACMTKKPAMVRASI